MKSHLQAGARGPGPEILERVALLGVDWRRRRWLAAIDGGLQPLRGVAVKLENKQARLGCCPGLAGVGIDPLASDKLLLAVSIEVRQVQRVDLRKRRIDIFLRPGPLAG